MKTNDLVYRLEKRAEIRRGIPRGEPDRISDLLEEAASFILHQQDLIAILQSYKKEEDE